MMQAEPTLTRNDFVALKRNVHKGIVSALYEEPRVLSTAAPNKALSLSLSLSLLSCPIPHRVCGNHFQCVRII